MLLMAAQLATAQCAAHAGGRKYVCSGMYTTTAVIGGTPTASGGTAPYTYCWSTSGTISMAAASYFLNDTTLANPTLVHNFGAPITFYLKVTDSLGCVSYDTCKVFISPGFINNLWNDAIYIDENFINSGDSILMDQGVNIVSAAPNMPCTYSWQPSYGLGTTTLATGFKALPHVSTVYSVTVTDSMGCKSPPSAVYYVHVCPAGYTVGYTPEQPCVYVGIKENYASRIDLSVYPNPVSGRIAVELPNSKIYTITLTTMVGTACKEISLAGEKTEIDLSYLNAGVYFLQVFEKGDLVAVKKIIKE